MTTDPLEFSSAETPEIHDNAPGKGAIAYRYGTHATILQRLLSRLQQQEILGPNSATPNRPLQALSIHARNDPAIALLDSWAMVADVLSFYQERIANEGYLRTAIEDRSILELSRTISYEVRPGVAAATPLVFTVEDAPGSEPVVLVPQGTQVQSIPMQLGEVPQTFETVEDLQARVEWNVLIPYLQQQPVKPIIQTETTELKLQGTNTLLQPGDTILIVGDERLKNPNSDRWYLRTVTTVEPYLQEGYTKIRFNPKLPETLPTEPQVFAFRQKASLFGYNSPQSSYLTVNGTGKIRTAPTPSSSTTLGPTAPTGSIIGEGTFFRTQLASGDILIVDDQVSQVDTISDDTSLTVKPAFNSSFSIFREFEFIRRNKANPPPKLQAAEEINLDTVYPKVLLQSWIVLSQPDLPSKTKLYRVNSTSTIFRTDPSLASQITSLKVDSMLELTFDVRKTSVLLQSEELALFQDTELKPVIDGKDGKTTIALNYVSPHLKSGQPVLISSSKNTIKVVTVEKMKDVNGYTELTIKETLQRENYDSETLKIYGNVVLANHGETIADEVLGSGDGSKANQQFTLKKLPLTYISTTTATGIQSTLKIYVNQVLWRQVQSLHNQDAHSQCYIVQTDEQGQARIIFGDGMRGARLPSGQENVRATYRSGIGHAGEVKAGSLILLQNRPLGIREVTNPIPAAGAADRDSFDLVRKNAPRTVLTLNHVISLRDFENFARSFAGIGKAQASLTWTGEIRQIYITVAGEDGEAAPLELCKTLQNAIAAAGTALQPVQVVPFDDKEGLFNLKAKVLVGDRYRFETIKPQIQQALNHAFSFHQREFGQGVAASEVIQIIQGVAGVVAVDLNALYLSSPQLPEQSQLSEQPKSLESFLVARLGRWEDGNAKPAQILLLNSTEQGTALEEWI